MRKFLLILTLLILPACSPPVDAPPPPTALPADTLPPTSVTTGTLTPLSPPTFCDDPRPREVIQSLQTAVQMKDGVLLASLISPADGMDVIYIRNGNVINYDVEHAKFVFKTTYQAEWGLGAGSGAPVIGSFQEVILPSLQTVFTPNTVVTCNALKIGGVTYVPEWISPNTPYYSIHFPGTEQFGNMDWQTWGAGMTLVDGKYYLVALAHYEWEP